MAIDFTPDKSTIDFTPDTASFGTQMGDLGKDVAGSVAGAVGHLMDTGARLGQALSDGPVEPYGAPGSYQDRFTKPFQHPARHEAPDEKEQIRRETQQKFQRSDTGQAIQGALDTPLGQAATEFGGAALQDVGTLTGVAGAVESAGGALARAADTGAGFRPSSVYAHGEMPFHEVDALPEPPQSAGPFTRDDFAPQKPRITPKAGESAQAAAVRQGVAPAPAPEVPAAPKPRITPKAGESAQDAAARQAAVQPPPETAPAPTVAPAASQPPSAAPDARGAPPPDVHHPDFFGAPDNQDLKSAPAGPAEQAARQAAVERGAPTLPAVRDSAITNDYATQGRDWVGKQAGDPTATAQIAAEGQALHSEAARISSETGGQQGVGESAATARGRAYQDWHDTTSEALDQHIKKAYATEDDAAKQISSGGENLKGVLGDDSLIDSQNAGAVRSSVGSLAKKMGVDLNDPDATLSAYQLENLRKHANAVYGNAPRFAQAVKNAVDADLPAGAYVQARKLKQIKSDMFGREGISQLGESKDIDPATKRPRPESRPVDAGDVMKKIEGMAPPQVGHIVKTMKRSSGVLKALGDDKAAEAVTDKALKAAQAVQSHFTERWIDEAHTGGGWNARRANKFLRGNQETLANVLSPDQMHQIRNVNSAANVLDMDKRYKGAFAQFTTGASMLRQRGGRAIEGLLSDLAPPGMNTLGELSGASEWVRNKIGGKSTANTPENFKRPLGATIGGGKQGGWVGFHGTQHEFAPEPGAPLGKFNSAKIGTGEGAQVYGHGLYLADEKNVANTYRVAGGQRVVDTGTGQPFKLSSDAKTAALEGRVVRGFSERGTDVYNGKLKSYAGGTEARRSSLRQAILTDPSLLSRDKLYMTDTLRRLKMNEGNVYHVHVPDEHVSKMLDWDKPVGDQPHVMKALQQLKNDRNPYLRNLGAGGPAVNGMTGEELYHSVSNIASGGSGRWDYGHEGGIIDRDPKLASAALNQIGIPGVRYLDQGSRLAGKGSRNMVLFDSKLADVVGKNDAALPGAQPPLGQMIGGGKQRGAVGNLNRAPQPTDRPATLNVGLHVGDPANGGRVMSAAEAIDGIEKAGGKVGRMSLVNSNTEPTLVADLKQALDKKTLGNLSKDLGQGAIAQRHSDGTGILAGPKAADWGGKYDPDYFRMHSGVTATEHAARQTVDNATAQHYPGIYDPPAHVVSRVETAPEDPIMKQLFGKTRKDLHDDAIGRGDVAPDSIPGVETGSRARGAAAAKNVTTDANAARLRDTISAFKDAHPDAYHGMVGWYEMQPLHDKIASILKNPKAASAAYEKLNTLMGMASPGSDVNTEINRGTAAHMLASQGEFGKFEKYGGLPTSKGATKNAPELTDVRGHPYHSTAQTIPMRRYLDTGVGAQAPKTSMYIRASDAPGRVGSQYQNKVLVGDSHFSRGVGLADTRTSADPHGSISGPELADIHPWYHANVAKPSGMPSTSAQAVQWGALAHETGVDTAVGAPKLELFSQAVAKAAKRAGVTPEVMLERIIKGTAHAG